MRRFITSRFILIILGLIFIALGIIMLHAVFNVALHPYNVRDGLHIIGGLLTLIAFMFIEIIGFLTLRAGIIDD
jgi:hypothetical protein